MLECFSKLADLRMDRAPRILKKYSNQQRDQARQSQRIVGVQTRASLLRRGEYDSRS